jgi:hypothetical protein
MISLRLRTARVALVCISGLIASFALPSRLCAQDRLDGFYFLGNLGLSSQNSPANVPGANLSGSDRGTSVKLGLGMQWTPHWGIEGVYTTLGKLAIATPSGVANYDTRIATLSATATWPFSEKFALVARAGMGLALSDLRVPALNYSASGKQKPVVFGVGMRHAINPKLDFTVDYDYYNRVLRFQGGGSASASVLSAGLRYSF